MKKSRALRVRKDRKKEKRIIIRMSLTKVTLSIREKVLRIMKSPNLPSNSNRTIVRKLEETPFPFISNRLNESTFPTDTKS